jgi:uncharacterized lipoprotein NlpE involved in copper resistance
MTMFKKIIFISCVFISFVLVGCSNDQVSKDTQKSEEINIDKAIIDDSKIVFDTLQDAMDRTVQYGNTSDFGTLSSREYDEKVGFYLDEEHYFGHNMNQDKYTKEENELIELTINASTSYLEYVKSELIGDTAAKEQIIESFNRDMDSINKIINSSR